MMAGNSAIDITRATGMADSTGMAASTGVSRMMGNSRGNTGGETPAPAPALAALKQYFGYDSFRPGQSGLVTAILQRRDVLGVMPTGAGKSI